MNRREFIAAAGAVTTVGIAGCSGGGGSNTDSPASVAKAYFETFDGSDREDLLHPESPIDPETDGFEQLNLEVESVEAETEAIAEDIDSAGLAEVEVDRENTQNVEASNLSEDELDSIAENEEVTLVEGDLEMELSGERAEEAENTFNNLPFHVLTATDGSDWLILDNITYVASFGSDQ